MKVVFARAASPDATASSKRRRKVRTRERRALLTSVRRSILRTAFLAPGVLAIVQLSKASTPGEPGGEIGGADIRKHGPGVNGGDGPSSSRVHPPPPSHFASHLPRCAVEDPKMLHRAAGEPSA